MFADIDENVKKSKSKSKLSKKEKLVAKDWSETSDYFEKFNVIFNEEPKLSNQIEPGKEISYFLKIFDENLLSLIVEQTNLYAQQKPIKNWTPLSIPELKAYIGCLILMGIHQVPRLENYWSSDPLLGYKGVAEVFSSKRFKKITEALHCNDNNQCPTKDSPDYDKLYKLRPLIDSLNHNISEVYTSSSFLSVDESMIPFKGRSSIKQYMPMKPIKRGYKVWCLADSKTGFINKFEIYTGKEKDSVNVLEGLGERVVLKLTEKLEGRKCLVAFDNFFTSVPLLERLYEKDIYSVGTIRKDRANLPEMMKTNDKLRRGEFMFKMSGNLAAVKWQDSKPVTLLTTAVSPKDVTTVKRKNKDGSRETVYCPNVVDLYNRYMGGVDKFDQKKERYAIGRRSVKWWHRIFYFLIDLAIVNSYILYQISRRSQGDQLSYRLSLARQLINGFKSRKRRGKPVVFLANKKLVPEEVRLSEVGSHFPEKGSYRRCRICSTKANEKRTAYTCSQCKVPICVPLCFKKLHQKSQ